MAWLQLRIHTTQHHADSISDYLTALGAQAVTFMDAKDTPIYEPNIGEITYWQDTTVIGLFSADHKMDKVIATLKQHPLLATDFTYQLDPLEDKDWERAWMEDFHPMQFGTKLWICPSWCDIPDPSAVNILLDPGLAFGTGTHPTTALCLTWLDSLDLTNKTLVDFGCGSGILAIAAVKLGAKRVIGIDIDPQAIQASQENAHRNQISSQVEFYLSGQQPLIEADVVIANILSGPLIELCTVITGYAKPGADIALSGILIQQQTAIINCYQKYCRLNPVTTQDEWLRIDGTKLSN